MVFGRHKLKRAAFWYLDATALAVAVISRGPHEPQLEACAGFRGRSIRTSVFAPGILELARATGALSVASVAALGNSHARLVADTTAFDLNENGAGHENRDEETGYSLTSAQDTENARLLYDPNELDTVDSPRSSAPILSKVINNNGRSIMAQANRRAVNEAVALFKAAGLNLIQLDIEECARHALQDVLAAEAGSSHIHPTPATDPLTTVALSPALEAEATLLGDLLTVPIGLALARWGGQEG